MDGARRRSGERAGGGSCVAGQIGDEVEVVAPEGEVVRLERPAERGDELLGGGPSAGAAFGEDAAGELYIVEAQGRVLRIVAR